MSTRKIIMFVAGAVLVGSIATRADAESLLRSRLALVSGEDPSVSQLCPSAADARWDGVMIRVTLDNMDPARFPAGLLCETEVRVGSLTRRGVPLLTEVSEGCLPAVDVTVYDLRTTGVAAAGARVELRIRCERHETRWAGVF